MNTFDDREEEYMEQLAREDDDRMTAPQAQPGALLPTPRTDKPPRTQALLDDCIENDASIGDSFIRVARFARDLERELANRPTESQPVGWRHTLPEGGTFEGGNRHQLLFSLSEAEGEQLALGGTIATLYTHPSPGPKAQGTHVCSHRDFRDVCAECFAPTATGLTAKEWAAVHEMETRKSFSQTSRDIVAACVRRLSASTAGAGEMFNTVDSKTYTGSVTYPHLHNGRHKNLGATCITMGCARPTKDQA